jgi:hypothetical protein
LGKQEGQGPSGPPLQYTEKLADNPCNVKKHAALSKYRPFPQQQLLENQR